MTFNPKLKDDDGSHTGTSVNRTTYRHPNRFLEAAVACILLSITLPLMLFVALAIKWDSTGPVFEGEIRIVRGHRFKLLKFRTTALDPQGHRTLTTFGWFLHYTRIDLLPHLINLLRGDIRTMDLWEYLATD